VWSLPVAENFCQHLSQPEKAPKLVELVNASVVNGILEAVKDRCTGDVKQAVNLKALTITVAPQKHLG
jgi:hypothetical protein